MSHGNIEPVEGKGKKSKIPLLFSIVAFISATTVGYLISPQLLPSHSETDTGLSKNSNHQDQVTEKIAFIPLDPITVNLRSPTNSRHLRFRAQLEVPAMEQATVEKLLPRVLDVMNSYLQSIEEADVVSAAALLKMRSQLLHRVKLVVGKKSVNDILIMEFILN